MKRLRTLLLHAAMVEPGTVAEHQLRYRVGEIPARLRAGIPLHYCAAGTILDDNQRSWVGDRRRLARRREEQDLERVPEVNGPGDVYKCAVGEECRGKSRKPIVVERRALSEVSPENRGRTGNRCGQALETNARRQPASHGEPR